VGDELPRTTLASLGDASAEKTLLASAGGWGRHCYSGAGLAGLSLNRSADSGDMPARCGDQYQSRFVACSAFQAQLFLNHIGLFRESAFFHYQARYVACSQPGPHFLRLIGHGLYNLIRPCQAWVIRQSIRRQIGIFIRDTLRADPGQSSGTNQRRVRVQQLGADCFCYRPLIVCPERHNDLHGNK